MALESIAWYSGNSNGETHPVGEKQPNPWGLYDMLGNVDEWVQDQWRDNYRDAPSDGTPREGLKAGARRVYRSSSWFNLARFVRAAYRFGNGPGLRYGHLGFRCARVHAGQACQGAEPARPRESAEAKRSVARSALEGMGEA